MVPSRDTFRSPSSFLTVQAWRDIAVPQFPLGDEDASLALASLRHCSELEKAP